MSHADRKIHAVAIRDVDDRGVLVVDLVDLLRLAGSKALASRWRCSSVECLGPGADDLHAASDGPPVGGAALLALAENVHQVVDGSFAAANGSNDESWLIVRAIDSTEYVVVTDDHDLLLRIRAKYRDVRESPEDVEAP